MTNTCDECCVGKLEGGRVEVGIENPVVNVKQPVRPPPAALSDPERDVPNAVSHRVARKKCRALNASILLPAESMSVHRTTASMNQAARTCTVLFLSRGINRRQKLVRGHPKNSAESVTWCANAHHEITHILPYAVAPVTLLATPQNLQFSL